MKELLDVLLRALQDTSPRMGVYADALREHMAKKIRNSMMKTSQSIEVNKEKLYAFCRHYEWSTDDEECSWKKKV